ncbi:MAG: hypothetical protein FWB97_00640 [Oscillospiraceae bacterium]|nr:hypothetical protein [Oscillospiraceae bacterium]
MIGSVNSSSAFLAPQFNRQAPPQAGRLSPNGQQSAKLFMRRGEDISDPLSSNIRRGITTFKISTKLYSGGMNIGGGHFNAFVDWSENSTPDNPIMRVRGWDADGDFEAEVAINDIDPRRASLVEMFALNGYLRANGEPTVRLFSSDIGGQVGQEGGITGSTPIDVLALLRERMEDLRFHRHVSYPLLRDMVDMLSGFPRQ